MAVEIQQAYNEMTSFAPEQLKALGEPLSTSAIEHRPGAGGRQLAYISGKTAIDTANKIFGPGKWGYTVTSRSCEKSVNLDGTVSGVFYIATIELYVTGNPYSFPGEGFGNVAPNKYGVVTPEAHEKALKEATTDALKRALRHYGDQFGLALYDQDALVEAEDGSMVTVREAGKPAPVQQKRVVEAATVSAPKQIEKPDPKKVLAKIYIDGKAKGLWEDIAGMATYATPVLNVDMVTKDDLYKLSLEQVQQFAEHVGQAEAVVPESKPF